MNPERGGEGEISRFQIPGDIKRARTDTIRGREGGREVKVSNNYRQ